MKAISLHQPWATAVVLGLKRNETRGWPTRYRGPIAIHAALRWQQDQVVFARLARGHCALPTDLPRGVIVGVAWLTDCVTTSEICPTIGFQERMFGNYGPGRYAWLLEHAKPLSAPLEYRGKQGFFNVSDELLKPLLGDWLEQRAAEAVQLASYTA